MMTTDWYGCYNQSWKGAISDESFTHPAKFYRLLIERIYRHALAQGYLKEGDTILDPFGGVALGAFPAIRLGLNWVGVELEQKFVDLGHGCNCAGISKEDWIRFYGRWERAARRDGRHWCPECLREARIIAGETSVHLPQTTAQKKRLARIKELARSTGRIPSLYQPLPFPDRKDAQKPLPQQGYLLESPAARSASYKRGSGKIPCTQPHRYRGNIERWMSGEYSTGNAVLLQGDSRRLHETLAGMADTVAAVVSSPPYSVNEKRDYTSGTRDKARQGRGCFRGHYGHTDGQLVKLAEGDFDAVVSSPLFGNTEGVVAARKFAGEKSIVAKWQANQANPRSHNVSLEALSRQLARDNAQEYGDTPGNLGNLIATGTDFEAVISSPPFAGNTGGRGEASRRGIDPALFDRHSGGMIGGMGDSKGNVGSLPMRDSDFDAVVGSPPFAVSVGSDDPDKRGGLFRDPKRRGDVNLTANYGHSKGQLGTMKAGDFDALFSSPPYEGSVNQHPGANDTEARLERMQRAGIDVSQRANVGGQNGVARQPQTYGKTPGQMGAEIDDTFWAAARLIVEQCYEALKPGGIAVWVVKDFVRNKKRVPFADMWRQLCENCGFVSVETIRAWLVNPGPTQLAIIGDNVDFTTERKSFFRRLHERKYPQLSIDWEEVVVLRKLE